MEKVIVLTPIYKERFNAIEEKSMLNMVEILQGRKITFITPKKLDIGYYQKKFGTAVSFQLFPGKFFASVDGYSRLLLWPPFYKRFIDFKFAFIFQPDAWLFRDELDYWCDAGYDYIGAPWFRGMKDPIKPYEIIGAGNGGCCLRNIRSALKILHTFRYIRPPKRFLNESPWGILSYLKNSTVANNFFYLFND